jgi:hypothetical protein
VESLGAAAVQCRGGWTGTELEVGSRRIGGEGGGRQDIVYWMEGRARGKGEAGREKLLCSAGADGRVLSWKWGEDGLEVRGDLSVAVWGEGVDTDRRKGGLGGAAVQRRGDGRVLSWKWGEDGLEVREGGGGYSRRVQVYTCVEGMGKLPVCGG